MPHTALTLTTQKPLNQKCSSRGVQLRGGDKALMYMPVAPVGPVTAAQAHRVGAGEGVGLGESHVSTVALKAAGGGESSKSIVLARSPLKKFVVSFEKRLQGVAYWNEQAAADASAGLDMGKGKKSKKLLADERRLKLENWQQQAGGSGDAGSRIVMVWVCRDWSRMGAIFLRSVFLCVSVCVCVPLALPTPLSPPTLPHRVKACSRVSVRVSVSERECVRVCVRTFTDVCQTYVICMCLCPHVYRRMS